MHFEKKRYATELLLVHVQGFRVGVYVDGNVEEITPEFVDRIIKHLGFIKEDLPSRLDEAVVAPPNH